jgi:hypothetical protein
MAEVKATDGFGPVPEVWWNGNGDGAQSDSPEDEPITGHLVLSTCIPHSRIELSDFPAIRECRLPALMEAPTDWRKLENCSDDEVLFRRSGSPLFE